MHRIQKFALPSRKSPPAIVSAIRTATAEVAGPPVIDPIATAMDQAAVGMPRLLTPQEVADMLGLTERTLERWRITGEGPRYTKLSRSTVRYMRDDVAAFVAGRLRGNTAQ